MVWLLDWESFLLDEKKLSEEQLNYIIDKYGKNYNGVVELNGGSDIPNLNEEQIKYIINNYNKKDIISYVNLPDLEDMFKLNQKKKKI